MRTPLSLASSIATLYFAAETGGGSGGGSEKLTGAGTLKERLEAANARIGELDGEKTQLSTELQTEKEKTGQLEKDKTKLEQDLQAEKGKVSKLEQEKKDLQTKLTASEEKVTTLQGDAKTSDERAAEKAAANGHKPVQTSEAAKKQTEGADGAALYAQYSKLKGSAKTAFFREHEKALMTYAASLPAEETEA